MSIISIKLLSTIREQYSLNWYGTHGIYHWSRVFDNAAKLSQQKGVNAKVVALFSVVHDSQRWTESLDPAHGPRAESLITKLRELLPLDDDELELLKIACRVHTTAKIHENFVIGCCLDCDRLDLGRTGQTPNPKLLHTPLAKQPETIDWALRRSLENVLPDNAFGIQNFTKEMLII